MLPVTMPSRTPSPDQPRQQLLDPRHHPVALGLGDRVGEVAEVGDDRRGPLGIGAVAADHLAEDDLGDFGVGHPGVVCSSMSASTP